MAAEEKLFWVEPDKMSCKDGMTSRMGLAGGGSCKPLEFFLELGGSGAVGMGSYTYNNCTTTR